MDEDVPNPVDVTYEQVRLLLMLYRCPVPVPFHIVRSRSSIPLQIERVSAGSRLFVAKS
jgi:hypothetical protein